MEIQRLTCTFLAMAVSAAPASAQVACPAGQRTYLTCTADRGAKRLTACFDATSASLAYGAPGAVGLRIHAPLTETDIVPWPGIGPTMWSSLGFRLGGADYVVSGAVERGTGEADEVGTKVSGTLTVLEGDITRSRVDCDPGSVDYRDAFGLIDAVKALGRCYDDETQAWTACAPQD